MDEALDGLQ